MRDVLARWLEAEGFTIHQAGDAEAALEVVGRAPIAVMTIDKTMPGHDGLWLIEQIQQRHPTVAMLLATGDDSVPERVMLSRGVQGYLVKPLKRELLVSAVHDALVWHKVAAKRAAAQGPSKPSG